MKAFFIAAKLRYRNTKVVKIIIDIDISLHHRDLSHNLLSDFPTGFTMVEQYDSLLINDNPIGNLRSGLFSGNLTSIEIL